MELQGLRKQSRTMSGYLAKLKNLADQFAAGHYIEDEDLESRIAKHQSTLEINTPYANYSAKNAGTLANRGHGCGRGRNENAGRGPSGRLTMLARKS
ncbi:hypothetical protein TorRG33x02_197770 [Trema orientale]|uniref:Uncharacterized protein n=1 Tax=Trema orientale TaxID=63057 RepID=A0A2P5EG07_TREOI|nr:hypothetical protein TorRG33x02_197770 [Trema orientale]